MNICEGEQLLFILRGLPGSGKSSLSREIQHLHGQSNCVILSADTFRYNDKGEYFWSKEIEMKARQLCFERAVECCKNNIQIIIIDNTNRKFDDIKCYLKLANKMSYITVLLEPTTAWKFNIKELVNKNKHGVDINALEKMKIEYEIVTPHFYGWFISRETSLNLLDICNDVYNEICNNEVYKHFTNDDEKEATHSLRDSYPKCGNSTQNDMFHLTTFYLNSETTTKTISYYEHLLNAKLLGRSTVLHITAICFTKNTIFTLVKLTDDQLQLWNHELASDLTIQRYSHITIGHTNNVDSAQCKNDQGSFISTLYDDNLFSVQTRFGKLFQIGNYKWRLDFREIHKLPAVYSGHYPT